MRTLEKLKAMPDTEVNRLVHEAMGKTVKSYTAWEVMPQVVDLGMIRMVSYFLPCAERKTVTMEIPNYLHDKAAAWDVLIALIEKTGEMQISRYSMGIGTGFMHGNIHMKSWDLSIQKSICFAAILAATEKK